MYDYLYKMAAIINTPHPTHTHIALLEDNSNSKLVDGATAIFRTFAEHYLGFWSMWLRSDGTGLHMLMVTEAPTYRHTSEHLTKSISSPSNDQHTCKYYENWSRSACGWCVLHCAD